MFARIAAVYESPARESLTPEQQRLTWVYYTNFVRAGAQLGSAPKQRLSAINQRLAVLYTTFAQNVLADENEGVVEIGSETDPRPMGFSS